MKKAFLAGLTRAQFMRRHWQKEPLLARNALPQYATESSTAGINKDTLFTLAARDDVESRIIARVRGTWRVRHGPFTRSDFARMPACNWTLLVQGVDQLLPQSA